MGSAYVPGLEVSRSTIVRKTRELPLPGKSLVKVGDSVTPDSEVLSAELPGEVYIVRVADLMGVESVDAVSGMKVKTGDTVAKGELLCETKTFFGLFTSRLQSPVAGTVEFFTEGNAHLGIRQESTPLVVTAYVPGTIIDTEEGKFVTIETKGAFIQGIFGVGGERHGVITSLTASNDTEISASDLKKVDGSLENAIIIGGASFSTEAINYAAESGASAIVTGSIDAETLATFLQFEIGVSITGDEDVPLTLIITEGFGKLPLSPRIKDLADELHGKAASVNGATQVRAGAMRPEIIVSDEGAEKATVALEQKSLELGQRIRIIRVPYFGLFGEVSALPQEPQRIPSGAMVRVLEAILENGETVMIPRANVELV